MNDESLTGRKTQIEESMDSAEFFLSGIRQKIGILQAKRDGLKSTLNSLESEERSLKVKMNKLQGLMISQELRNRQDLEHARAQFKSSEELLWSSRVEKEDKCKKLETDIEAMRKKRGLAARPSRS